MQMRHGGESGSVLIVLLLFAAALLILGGALSIVTFTESAIARNQEQDTKLYYITEAGIEAGAAALGCCYDYSGKLEGSMGGGSFEVEMAGEPGLPRGHAQYERFPQRLGLGQRMVISKGTLQDQSMIMAVIVERRGEPPAEEPPEEDDDGRPQQTGGEGVVIVEWIDPWRL